MKIHIKRSWLREDPDPKKDGNWLLLKQEHVQHVHALVKITGATEDEARFVKQHGSPREGSRRYTYIALFVVNTHHAWVWKDKTVIVDD